MTFSLVLDTAFDTCQAGLWQGDIFVASVAEQTPGGRYDQSLAPLVAGLLKEAAVKPRDLSDVFVTSGIGRFTGLRVGLAFARALVLPYATPLVGIPTQDVFAAQLKKRYNGHGVIVLAVRKNESFVMFLTKDGVTVPQAVLDDDLVAHLTTQGPVTLAGVWPSSYESTLLHHPDITLDRAASQLSLETILKLGRQVKANSGEPLALTARPFYAS